MARLAEEPTLSYQGILCRRGAYQRGQGVGPGHGFVEMPQASFRRLISGDPWAPHHETSSSNADPSNANADGNLAQYLLRPIGQRCHGMSKQGPFARSVIRTVVHLNPRLSP